ncbi:MAG: o-succinylbenzoate synthase, partial [Thermoanaerobaculia bacterium]|nr:o-succinylbenzoate synthase [Thermoanaerobaculia bacterium]
STTPSAILDRFAWIRGHPMATAAVEMAAWDLAARARGVSLAEALGGRAEWVPVGVSVGFRSSLEELLRTVEGHVSRGYRRVKVKIGPGRDVEILDAVRSRLGPEVDLLADANGAYGLEDASLLKELDAFGLVMLEQPLPAADLLGHARLQETLDTPLCLDESLTCVADLEVALELGACRIVNIKPGRMGGLGEAVRTHDLCLDRGVAAWCGGMLESGVGRAHNLALASLPGFTLPGDLSESARYWERDLVDPPFVLEDGGLRVPTATGIGVELDEAFVREVTVRSASF